MWDFQVVPLERMDVPCSFFFPSLWNVEAMGGAVAAILFIEMGATHAEWQSNKTERAWLPDARESIHHNSNRPSTREISI